MSNLLYRCALSKPSYTNSNVPNEALLRLYGPSHGDKDLQIEIFNQLAAENLGPSLYASFDEGRFEEYLSSSPLSIAEMTSMEVSKAIAKKLAAVHKLNIENMEKNSDWLMNCYRRYENFISTIRHNPLKFDQDTLDSTKTVARELLNIDFRSEIDFLDALFSNSDAPLVFSHNDLHQNNILLLHDPNRQASLDDPIVLIDFEYSSYNYRTFDIANHLSEWCFDYNTDRYPFFKSSPDLFPPIDKQKQFLCHYITGSDQMGTQQLTNGSYESLDDRIEALFEEMQPFLLASNLLWTLWAIFNANTSKIKFGFWVSLKVFIDPANRTI